MVGGGGKANSTNSVSENVSVFSWINMNILSMFWGPWPFLKIINRFGKFARIGSLDSDTQERVQKKQENTTCDGQVDVGEQQSVKKQDSSAIQLLGQYLRAVFEDVENKLLAWKASGQLCQKDDLLCEFDYRLGQKIIELEKEKDLKESLKTKVLAALRKKQSQHHAAKGRYATFRQMQRLFKCRFLKPQLADSVSDDDDNHDVSSGQATSDDDDSDDLRRWPMKGDGFNGLGKPIFNQNDGDQVHYSSRRTCDSHGCGRIFCDVCLP